MNSVFRNRLYIILMGVLLYSCATSDIGSAKKNEKLHMRIKEQRNVINTGKLAKQRVMTLGERSQFDTVDSRGFISSGAGSLVSLATNAVKTIIANDRKKYVADYQFGLTDLYFYDQLSGESPFDPVGMQFSGFRLTRTFINKSSQVDTALIADFALDTSNREEIINNSLFRLRLKNIEVRNAKAKVTREKKLNMDFEITFLSSYVTAEGIIHDSVVLGKFYLFLRDAPLDRLAPGYHEYYDKMKDTLIMGKAFIIPRSFGYHREPDGLVHSGYSQGSYSIQVKVKESSRDRFVNKLLFENANMMVDAAGNQLKISVTNKLK